MKFSCGSPSLPESGSAVRRVIARITALLPKHWLGLPGRYFDRTVNIISEFVRRNNVDAAEIADGAVELGRRKLIGLGNREYAATLKDFADAEQKRIQAELERRSLEI